MFYFHTGTSKTIPERGHAVIDSHISSVNSHEIGRVPTPKTITAPRHTYASNRNGLRESRVVFAPRAYKTVAQKCACL